MGWLGAVPWGSEQGCFTHSHIPLARVEQSCHPPRTQWALPSMASGDGAHQPGMLLCV